MMTHSDAYNARLKRIAALPFEDVSTLRVGPIRAFQNSWQSRELLDLLIRREIRSRYKDSSLGIVWALIRPLVMLLIYYLVIGKVLGAERGIPQFAIFVFAGLTIWGYFAEIVTSGTTSIVSNAGLIKKIYLPREIFPLAALGSATFNFVLQLSILFVATFLLGQFPFSSELLFLPVAIALVVVFGFAAALFLSAVNVYLRDVQYLVEVLLLIAFWVSPILYSYPFVQAALSGSGLPSWLTELYLSNPLTLAILGFQKATWAAGSPEMFPDALGIRMILALMIGTIFVLISQRVFSRLQGNFAQEI